MIEAAEAQDVPIGLTLGFLDVSAREELPEYQIFSVLRQGEEEAIGPFSQDQLVELLNDGDINSSDLVYYEGMEDWAPISAVFDLHQAIGNFEDDGQDKELLADAFAQLGAEVGDDEPIYYIAVQDLPALSLTGTVRLTSPKSVAITESRICIVHHRLTGKLEFEFYSFPEVCDATKRIKADEKKGVFSILLNSGERIEVDKIPRAQLEKLEQLSSDLNTSEEEEESGDE